ncbi:MAG: hypothetical protein Q9208_005236 [Pyrenodesmia sp. 3 TL-2023]
MMHPSSTTKDKGVEENESMIDQVKLWPILVEGAKDGGVYSKMIDNPIEIALRALVDENGLGNYAESEERAISCFRLGLWAQRTVECKPSELESLTIIVPQQIVLWRKNLLASQMLSSDAVYTTFQVTSFVHLQNS